MQRFKLRVKTLLLEYQRYEGEFIGGHDKDYMLWIRSFW